METPPRLSILIISWNTRTITRNCLLSVREGLGEFPAEIILVDNDSSDGSAEMVAEEFPEVQLIRNPKNVGFAAANNQAMEIATGEFFLLLNSDTLVLDNVLQQSVAYLESNPKVGIMGCRVLNHDKTLQVSCSRYPSFLNLLLMTAGLDRLSKPRWFQRYRFPLASPNQQQSVDTISGCFLMIRSSTAEQVGFMDDGFFFFGEETDWCRRVKISGWDIRYAPVGEIVHLGGQSAKKLDGRRDILLTAGFVRLHRKHSGLPGAAMIWLLLFLFNTTRLWHWRIRSRLQRREENRARARHFAQVVNGFSEVWALAAEKE
jgi:GT2 family glycosyltransferase